MNEHELQRKLTARWAAKGLQINGCRHFLVAWEVMAPSWRINDAGKFWSEPSADFLVCDEYMRCTVIELKRIIRGVKPCWLALSQVTHRALVLTRTISRTNLERAYHACWSGAHGRICGRKPLPPLVEHHRQFFRLASCVRLDVHEIQRCVATQEFSPAWSRVLQEFNQLNGKALQTRVRKELTSKSANREVSRLSAISTTEMDLLRLPVISLKVA